MEHRFSGHDGCALVVSNDLADAEAFAQTIRTTLADEAHDPARGRSFEQPPILVMRHPVTVLDITQPSRSDAMARLRLLGLPIMVAVGGVGYDEGHDEWFLRRGAGFGPTSWGAARGALVVHLAGRIAAARAVGDDMPTGGSAAEVRWGRVLRAPAELCREALDLVAMGSAR